MAQEPTSSIYRQISTSLFNQKYSFYHSTQLRLWGPEAGTGTILDLCYGLRKSKMNHENKIRMLQSNKQAESHASKKSNELEEQGAYSKSWGKLVKATPDSDGKLSVTVIDEEGRDFYPGYRSNPDKPSDEIEFFYVNIPVESSQKGAACLFLILTAQRLRSLKQLLETPADQFPRFDSGKSLEEALVPLSQIPEVKQDAQASSIITELLEALAKENPDTEELTPEDRKARYLAQCLSHAPGRTGHVIINGETLCFQPDEVELDYPCPSPNYGGDFWGFFLTR